MRRYLSALAILACFGTVHAHGLLIPAEKKLPPLAMLNHLVNITIDNQVAMTKVEQTFRNHTSRQLEATYFFPVPKGASVNSFSMYVGGKEVKGELVEAEKARKIYTSIVRQTQDPGLLEYMGNRIFRLRIFPVPANGDQKVTLEYTSVVPKDKDLIEYVYPLKTDGKATETLEKLSITAKIKSKHGVQNVYSPTHSIGLKRAGDNEVTVTFDRDQGLLDKDFQLFYQLSDKDVGLTTMIHRPVSSEDGYFLMLISPKVELEKKYQVPRDMVFVLDTSGSMRGEKMLQAKKALRYCLDNLGKDDRFALVNFATTTNQFRNKLAPVTPDKINQAKKWVDRLSARGGTAIHDALQTALELREDKEGRTFTVVFFTDGLPTIGEIKPAKILSDTLEKNTSSTRIFTFGVGNDVNATLLDQLAEKTRALTTYVRPSESIETKVSSLFGKISHPVLANLRLTTTGEVSLNEIYPAQLPDLFHGSQLTLLGRYHGNGPAAIKLTGTVGKETKEFVYEMSFDQKTKEDKEFVEHLWARRKVGYLLDQMRANGEKKELKEEVIALAKRYSIVTPYTSHLIVPDGAVPIVTQPGRRAVPHVEFNGRTTSKAPAILAPKAKGAKQTSVEHFGRLANARPGDLGRSRGGYADRQLKDWVPGKAGAGDKAGQSLVEAKNKFDSYRMAQRELLSKKVANVQQGKLGVDLSCFNNCLRNQTQLVQTALRNVNSRTCMEVGGVWVDQGFHAKTEAVVVKAQSNAYFRILKLKPEMKKVYTLGNHLIWVTPSGTALVIDSANGKDEMKDDEINKLFVVKK